MDKKNIILIGMPGSGKSTTGILAAKTLGMSFIDTDILIQQKENRLLQHIINKDGIKSFLDIEKNSVLEINAQNCIISTGGSVVYSKEAMMHLTGNGLCIYLQLTYDEMIKRIKNITTRGIVLADGQNLKDMYNERIPLYERYADITIPCSAKGVEQVVAEVVRAVDS